MKKYISLTQIKTIKYELNYYSQYCDIEFKNEIISFLSKTNDEEIKNIIFNLCRGVINDLVLYFYLHSDMNGNITSINSSLINNPFVKENYLLFKEINDSFLEKLFTNDDPLYFLDVDNTLTDAGFLSDEKIQFIRSFKNKENIILSTGKVSDAIMNVINDCHLNENYYSCLNGSVIHNKNEHILLNGIGTVSKDIIDKFMNTNISFVFYYYDSIMALRPLLQKDLDNLEKFNENFEYINSNIEYDKIIKILAFIDEDGSEESKNNEQIIREMISEYKDLHCVRTAPHTFEVLRIDQHKGNSVRKISELKGKYYRLSVGAGDSMNDFPMLEHVGIPYSVYKSSEQLKKLNYDVLDTNSNIDIVNMLKRHGGIL